MAGEQRQPVAPDARVEARIDANMNQIDVFRAIFVAAGCPGAPFDTANWLRAGFTDATFLSHLRFATQFETAQELQNVLLLGRDARIFTSLLGMSNAQFYNLLSWLRSPQGQAAVTDYLALQRFARRGRGYMEATDLGWVNILEEQRQVFENERKEIRRTGDAEIAALERQLRIRRARLNTDLEAIRANHQPASSYVPLEGRQLLIASWEEYINAMAVAGEQPMPQTVTQVLKAQENYGEIAMKRHRLAFVNQGNHKEMLTTFLNNTIGRFRADGDDRPAKRFRTLMAAAGIRPTPQVPIIREEVAAVQNPGGGANPDVAEDAFDQALEQLGTGPFGRAPAGGNPAEARHQPGDGNEVVQPGDLAGPS
ncbi:TPA_asm: hypothetical protein [Swertia japonica amalgavirus 1]|nr:TPA_asm: hypothetical protein [Swertia japonica amalgavirus 1]